MQSLQLTGGIRLISAECGSFIVMAYNFMPLFRHEFINSGKKQFPKRYDLISTPAYMGTNCHKTIPALHNGNG